MRRLWSDLGPIKTIWKESFQICIWIQSLFSFTLNLSPCQHQCCLRRPCGHQPNNVSHVGIRFYRDLCSFFNRSSSFPNIFFAKSHLEGNCETANWSLSNRCSWDYVEDCSANPLKCLNLTIFQRTPCWNFISWYIIYRIYPNRVLYLKAFPE